jgi:protein-disulfide isomerase
MSKNQKILLGILLLLSLLIGGWALYDFNKAPSLPNVAGGDIDPGVVRPEDHTLGNPKARVVVVEYGSPACSVCAAWNAQVLPPLKAQYIDTGKILYVYRLFLLNFPLEADVARMAMCLPKDQFLPFLDFMYRNQPEWDIGEYRNIPNPEPALLRLARVAGFTPERLAQCRAPNPAADDEINRTQIAGQRAYNIGGTPTIIVNGKKLRGVPGFGDMQNAIEAALAGK